MSFSVTVLGSGSALPTSTRFPSAHALKLHERMFLIDCGEGTQIQLQRYKLKFSRLHHIFISHLHGDHVLGLFGLISTLNLMGRTSELHVFAHQSFEPILEANVRFFVNDISFPLTFHPLEPQHCGAILSDKHIEVSAFPLKHRIPSFGFVFREQAKELNIRKDLIAKYEIPVAEIVKIKAGADFMLSDGTLIPNEQLTFRQSLPRMYAHCTDTMFSEDTAHMVKGADLLYHEATFGNDHEDTARITGHSTAQQAARVAHDAKVKRLLIGHFSSRYKVMEQLLKEARALFPETYLAEEGRQFEI